MKFPTANITLTAEWVYKVVERVHPGVHLGTLSWSRSTPWNFEMEQEYTLNFKLEQEYTLELRDGTLLDSAPASISPSGVLHAACA